VRSVELLPCGAVSSHCWRVEAIAILSAALIAIVGWGVNAELQRRELRRQTLVRFLLDAYRRLEATSNRRRLDATAKMELERAVSDIVLLGTRDHVRLVEDAARQLQDQGSSDFTPLLRALRASLRQELRLDEAEWISFRMKDISGRVGDAPLGVQEATTRRKAR